MSNKETITEDTKQDIQNKDIILEDPQCVQVPDDYDLIYERPYTLTDTKFHYCP